MKLLIVAATYMEIEPTLVYCQKHLEALTPITFKKDDVEISMMITAVGMPLTTFSLCFLLYENKFDLIIQAGIAGAIDRKLEIGEVVEVVSDCMADLGVEHADGSFQSMHELGMLPEKDYPFRDGRLWNQPEVERAFLPKVHGITVNKVHGSAASIKELKKNFPFAQVESMEGAAFFLVGLQIQGHLMQLRAISNYVAPRNRDAWEMELAITNLNEVVIEIINSL